MPTPALIVASGFKGGRTTMKGNKSSQYFTALLQVASYAQTDVEIHVKGDLVSKPYIDLTIAVMRDFGIEVTNNNYRSFTVRAGQRYHPAPTRSNPMHPTPLIFLPQPHLPAVACAYTI